MTATRSTALVPRLLVAAIAAGSIALSYRLTSPLVLSYHDEGIYLATSWALSGGQGYRLINLPTPWPQTKYPPVYPLALTLAGPRPDPGSPQLRQFKGVNAVCLGLIVFLTGELAALFSRGAPMSRVLAALLASTSLGLVTHVDLVGADLLFIVWLVAAVLAVPISPSTSWRRAVAAGILLGLAALTRSVGVPAAIGATAFVGIRNRNNGLLVGVIAASMIGAWALWSSQAAVPGLTPLERYYTTYDHVVWVDGLANPRFVWSVVSNNGLRYIHALPKALGAPHFTVTVVLFFGLVVGIRRTPADGVRSLLMWMAGAYALALIGVPYVVLRYLLPAIPLTCAWLATAAAKDTRARVKAADPYDALGLACALFMLVVNVMELNHYSKLPDDALNVGFAESLPFRARGFLQTADWIRRETPVDAVLASANDSEYFVQTGRRGIRPWPMESAQYDSAYIVTTAPAPLEAVPPMLRKLGVSYLVVDPYLPDLEGQNASRYMSAILHAPGDRWTEVFRSDDGLHRVYRHEDASGGK